MFSSLSKGSTFRYQNWLARFLDAYLSLYKHYWTENAEELQQIRDKEPFVETKNFHYNNAVWNLLFFKQSQRIYNFTSRVKKCRFLLFLNCVLQLRFRIILYYLNCIWNIKHFLFSMNSSSSFVTIGGFVISNHIFCDELK